MSVIESKLRKDEKFARRAFQAGQAFGDAGAILSGTREVITGFTGEAAGLILDATGAGAVAGLPLGVISATLIVHGGATATTGFVHLRKATVGRSGGRNWRQDKKLTKGEIRKLKESGHDVERMKTNRGVRAGGHNLYKDRQGNIYAKGPGGSGPGSPTGVNINEL